jgi:hypothetical protein
MTFLAGAALLAYLFARYRKDPHAMQLWTDGQALVTAGPAIPDGPSPQKANPNAERRRRKKRS